LCDSGGELFPYDLRRREPRGKQGQERAASFLFGESAGREEWRESSEKEKLFASKKLKALVGRRGRQRGTDVTQLSGEADGWQIVEELNEEDTRTGPAESVQPILPAGNEQFLSEDGAEHRAFLRCRSGS
jgi:hypothetical protein